MTIVLWASRLLLAGILLFRAVRTAFGSPEQLVAQAPDDVYYYYQVARHIASGVGSTFDGINATNGYHPLWMMLCAAVAMLFQPSSVELATLLYYARTMQLLQLVCAGAGMILFVRAVRKWFPQDHFAEAFAWGVCATPMVIYGATDGLESGLVLLFVGGLLSWFSQFDALELEPTRALSFGAFLALGFLARLDLALLLLALGFAVLVQTRPWRLGFKNGLLWGVPVLATLAIYLALNRIHFGLWTPISGQLKSSGPWSFHTDRLLPFAPAWGAGAIAAVAALLVWFSQTAPLGRRIALVAGGLFLALHAFHSLVIMAWGVHQWHFTAYWFFGAVAFLHLASGARRVVGAAAVMLLLAAIPGQWLFLRDREERAFQVQSYRAALWARENISSGALLAMSDSGVFGYYRGGPVINLDGLINGTEYQTALAYGGLNLYLSRNKVRFLVHHAYPLARLRVDGGVATFQRYSQLVWLHKGTSAVRVTPQQVVYSKQFNDGTGEQLFAIWRLESDPIAR